MNIKLKDLEAEVIMLATERPNHVYDSNGGCSYVGTETGQVGGEGCIVGQALMRLGVPEEALREWENGTTSSTTFSDLVTEMETLTFDEDPLAVKFIREVQRNQDFQRTWGQSVSRAHGYYSNPVRIINAQ